MKHSLITAPETGHFVEAYVVDGSNWNIAVQYIPQQPLGLAHAVKTAKPFLGSDPFVMCLGDNITGQGLAGFIEKFVSERLDALIILKEVENPSSFGIAQLDKEGNIVQLVEKPKTPMGNLAIIGTYLFSSRIHEAIERIVPSWRGELEITDAIQEMIRMGFTVKAELLNSWWLDTGKKDDILSANAIILDECVSYDVKGSVVNSTLVGRVRVEADTEIINSVVRGPCVIGKNVLVENSFIGPYTSIGDNTKIGNSNLEYCVVQDGVTIQDVERLEDSLIGKNAKVTRNLRNRTLKLHVGDYSELEV